MTDTAISPQDAKTGPPRFRKNERALDGFKLVLHHCLAEVERNWDGAIADDEDAIHDLRIAIRRSRAVVGVAKKVIADDTRAMFTNELRWLANATSDARDLDVALDGWSKLIAGLPADSQAALEPVRLRIVERQAAAHDAMRAQLGSERARAFLVEWVTWLEVADGTTEADALTSLWSIVKHRIERGHRRLVAHEHEGIERHELRKEIKQLRYIIESFQRLLPTKPRKRFVEVLQQLQNKLGRGQDIVVQIALLEAMASDAPFAADTLSALDQLTAHLRHEQARADNAHGRGTRYATKTVARHVKSLVRR